MESRYREEDAQAMVARHGPRWGPELALRVYTSRLLGSDAALVLHGGGNTSVKATAVDLFGDPVEVLYVKGSGSDLASIDPEGFPACRLAPLLRACRQSAMTDEEMVALLRSQLLDPEGPTPSVEALLHALLPSRFVDHTHADAALSILDQPDSEALALEVWGEEALFVPYVMPGFALAHRTAELLGARRAPARMLVLDKHGLFTWGESARESYERMIAAVSSAERAIARRRRTAAAPTPSAAPAPARASAQGLSLDEVAPLLRGALARAAGRRFVVRRREAPVLVSFTARADVARLSQLGCATPDHVLRTRPAPLLVPPLPPGDPAAARALLERALAEHAARYEDGFRRYCEVRGASPRPLDPLPRVVLVPGRGALAVGRTAAEADAAADLYEHTVQVIEDAEAIGAYRPVSALELLDVEYWSLEQAKLTRVGVPRGSLEGRVALVTGAARGIGLATARALLDEGAHVVLADRDERELWEAMAALPAATARRAVGSVCDVTSPDDARAAVRRSTEAFGGLDVVVSNAGSAPSGLLDTPDGDRALRSSLELNLLGHQNVARAAVEVLKLQASGGVLLFNASKSAFGPGPEFGPYAVAKAALVALMRQYAIDLGTHGIRACAVNADRVRTGLFDGGVLEARARARGVAVDEYFRANLLRRETTAHDVARAFVHLSTAEATTGCVLTVDGGNPAAFPR